MSGAVEGVALRKIIRDMLDGKAGARDAARQVLTAPPARSYADGVSLKTKPSDGEIDCEFDDGEYSLTWPTGEWLVAHPNGKITVGISPRADTKPYQTTIAAIRLLSQGGKA